VLFGIRKYLQSGTPADMARWEAATDQAVLQLEDTLAHFGLKEISSSLQVDDRLAYLMTLSRLSTIVTLYRKPSGIFDKKATLEMLEVQLKRLTQFLRPLDDDLANAFERDAIA
jgi:hypothetical protein